MSAKSDAQGKTVEFEFDGENYIVPPASEWDLDVLENYEDGLIAKTVKALLGEEQYATFRSKKRTVGDLNDLFQAMQAAIGVQGN